MTNPMEYTAMMLGLRGPEA